MEMFSPKILENFKRGDESAFRYYYEMYYPALCLFGIRMVKEEDDVLDIVQDVFVNLWKARETIESLVHMRMYLYQSMRHRCLNYMRVKKLEETYCHEYALLESEEGFGDAVVEEEIHRSVMEEIEQLPPEQRRVIMWHLEGKNNIEIAEILKVSVNTVKTHKARARQQLKTKLKDLFVMTFVLGL